MGMQNFFKTFTVDRNQITDIEKWLGDGNNLGDVAIRNFLGKIRVDVTHQEDESQLRSLAEGQRK